MHNRSFRIFQVLKKFEALNVSIIGVSKDSIKKTRKNLSKKHNLKIDLASDEMVQFVKNLEFGQKSPCMVKNIWELKDQLFV